MPAAATRAWYLPTWVNMNIPVTSPTAHTPSAARSVSSTGTRPWSSSIPTASTPSPSPRGARPVAMSRRSPRTRTPSSSSSTYPSPSRSADRACTPRCSSIPSARSACATASPTAGASRASRRCPSTTTTSPPSVLTAWAISTPTEPPPITSRRRGTRRMRVTSRLVHRPSSSARPSTGGMMGRDPVASTMRSARNARPSTSTTPGPAMRPPPRMRVMPLPSSHLTWPASSQPPVIQSRNSRAASTSRGPVMASRAPGTRRAAARASPGRSRVLLGMQAQYEHSPATSSRSTTDTRMPPSARAPAQTSPAAPAPITIASKASDMRTSPCQVERRPRGGRCA